MRFTRVKTTLMTGMLAASMVMPGMAVYAAEEPETPAEQTITANTTAPTINKLVNVAKGITVPTTDANKIQFTVTQFDCETTSTTTYENGDGTQQPTIFLNADGSKKSWTLDLGTLSAIAEGQADYSGIGNNQTGTASLSTFVGSDWAYGEYTFEITETSPVSKADGTEYGWTIDNAKYYLHVYVGNTTTGREVKYLVTKGKSTTAGTGTDKKYEEKVSEIKFSNTYTKKGGSDETGGDTDPKKSGSFVISKTVDGDSAKYEQTGATYEFTVKLTNSNTSSIADQSTFGYKIYKNGSTEVVKSGTMTVKKNGNSYDATENIVLESDQYVVFDNIPAGVTAKVEEVKNKNVNIQKIHVTSTSNGEKVTGKDNAESSDSGDILIGEKHNEAAFTNTYSDVTVTGVVTDIAPYVTLVAAAVLAIAAYMGLKNRIAR